MALQLRPLRSKASTTMWSFANTCGGFMAAERAVGVLGSPCRSNGYRSGQAALVTRAGGMHTLSCGDQLQVPV